MAVAVLLVASLLAVLAPSRAAADWPAPIPPAAGWLATVNYYRAMAGLPPAAENAAWSNGGMLHSRYMVKNNQITHEENPANPWYTAAGDAAGRNGNVHMAFGGCAPVNERSVVEGWMVGPFHGIGIIDPRLQTSGFGSYAEGGTCGATLDVLRGRTGPAPTAPVAFPGGGRTTPLLTYDGGESPDPLSSCAGYTSPTGAPIYLQLPHASNLTSFSVRQNGVVVPSCAYDGSTYTNPTPAWQNLGQSILNSRNAVVVIPRNPLVSGAAYQVNVQSGATNYTWVFYACTASPCRGQLGDFNADYRGDLVWRKTDGQNIIWVMNGTTFSQAAALPAVPAPWQMVATADFDNNGTPELVWRNPTSGANTIWTMNGPAFLANNPLGPLPGAQWVIGTAGDFSGDGRPDLLWRNQTTGQNVMWQMNGVVFQQTIPVSQVTDTTWTILGSGDFNGDGRLDLIWRNTTTNQVLLWLMNGAIFQSVANWGIVPPQWQFGGTGDYNQDGRTDIVWRNTTNGQNLAWLMNGTVFQQVFVFSTVGDLSWSIVGP